jgi:enoyl-CoA hydratase/carnithine racemase
MFDVSSAVNTILSDSTAIIKFNRPTERNPLSVATLDQLRAEFSTLTARDDVQAIIFTGTDDVFSSGANIRELAKLDSQSAKQFAKFGQDLFQQIADARQVTIAAINGYCMGGALDLTLACDVRVASKDAVFAHPGVQLGIITGWGGTQRLPRLVGQARALEILLTARRLTSQEALDIGLVTGLSDPVLDYALQVARSCQKKVVS